MSRSADRRRPTSSVDLLILVNVGIECGQHSADDAPVDTNHTDGHRMIHNSSDAESSQLKSRTRLNATNIPSPRSCDECLERFRRWFTSYIADNEEHSLSIAISTGRH